MISKTKILDYLATYRRLFDKQGEVKSIEEREKAFINGYGCYVSKQENFSKIPGSPIAYWISKNMLNVFVNGKQMNNFGIPRTGIMTGDNKRFLRLWWEVEKEKSALYCNTSDEAVNSKKRWFPYNKGGDYRRWYGNNDYLINWYNSGEEVFGQSKAEKRNSQDYPDEYKFKHAISWSLVTSSIPAFRKKEHNLSDIAGPSFFCDDKYFNYLLGFCNSKNATSILNMLNPTINFQGGNIAQLPIIIGDKDKVETIVDGNIAISNNDWDSFETSWDFKIHPLVKNHVSTISEAYNLWFKECGERFNELKANEEELNRIFIDIYGLQDELTPEVEDKDVTVRKADLVRDIKSFISYAVGCMFGRYSLDVEGLAYAGGDWDSSKYTTFIPDTDDIVPICDEEYFEDDIVSRFVEFVSVVYGSGTLEENLKFITDALGGKGTPREVLRNYFLNDFFKDHCNTYQVTGSGKRPIYWLFDSGKKNGFKALVYIHRYTPDLIARMRTGYIHPQQARYRTQIELLQEQIDMAGSTSEKVKLSKQLKKINEQLLELSKYEETVHHWADKMEPMDLDDGVKANYAKFQELLAKIK